MGTPALDSELLNLCLYFVCLWLLLRRIDTVHFNTYEEVALLALQAAVAVQMALAGQNHIPGRRGWSVAWLFSSS
jgi:hypothetical protein